MAPSTEWQLTRDAAERYEDVLVREILGPLARSLVEWAAIRPGEWVLDIGCGTGAATRCAAEKAGAYGRVVGVDSSLAMLDVARGLPVYAGDPPASPIDWQEGSVYELALPSKVFDIALCAQTLPFLADPRLALKEIHRVLRPGGRFVFSLWSGMPASPYFQALISAVSGALGTGAAAGLGLALAPVDLDEIQAQLQQTRFRSLLRTVNRQDFRLPDLETFVPRHLSATQIAAEFAAAPAETRQAILSAVQTELEPQLAATGGWLPFYAHFLRAFA